MTRKSFSRKLLTCFAVLAVLCAMLAVSVQAAGKTVYLDAEFGNDSYIGTAPSAAFATLDKAINSVADGGTIVLMNDYVISADYVQPAHTGEIVITGKDGATDYKSTLSFPVTKITYLRLSGPTTFRDMTISMTNFVIFTANFHAITFDTGLTVTNGAKYAFVVGGYHGPESVDLPADLDSHITINSGTLYKVCGFTRNKGAGTMTYTGTSHITLNDGTVTEIYGGSLVNHYAGNTDIVINGGTVSAVYTAGDVTRQMLGNAKVTVNGGVVGKLSVNNTMGEVKVYLYGGRVGTAAVEYANDTLKKNAEKTRMLKAIFCDATLFGPTQIERFKETFDAYENLAKVYVKAGGTGDGSTADKPVGTLAEGYNILCENGGTVYVIGSVPFGNSVEYKKPSESIRIAGVDLGDIQFNPGTYTFEGNITFENIRLASSGVLALVSKDGSLTIGEGVVTNFTGFSLAGCGTSSSITVRAGSIEAITAGVRGNGTHNVTVLGGAVGKIQMISGAGSIASSEVLVSAGTVNNILIAANSVRDKLVLRLRGGHIANVELGALSAEVLCDIEGGDIEKFNISGQLTNGALMYGEAADKDIIAGIEDKFGEKIDANLVYLADGASGDGSSATNALGDLNAAIVALGGEDGTIVVSGVYTVGSAYTVRTHTNKVTITSYDHINDYRENGAALTLAANITLGGETVIDNININAAATAVIYAKGSPLTIGEDVATVLTISNTTYPGIVGGHNNLLASQTTSVTVKSGDWSSFRGGYNSTRLLASGLVHNVNISGGTFHSYVSFASRGNTSGTIVANISGGTFLAGVYAIYEEDASGYDLKYDITLIVTGGDFSSGGCPGKEP